MPNNKFFLIIVILIIASCSDNSITINKDTETTNVELPIDYGLKNQIMYIGNGAEPQGLDPHIVTGVPEHHLLITMCEGLTSSNPNGGLPLPGMAESWTISDDGRTYIFNINPDAKWSNGDQVTANDFVWSWMRILTPTLGSQYPDMLYYVQGAQDFNQKKINKDHKNLREITTGSRTSDGNITPES